MHHGALNALALFDKPDPLDGPFFEETIYVTPSTAPDAMQWDILDAVSRAAAAIGLTHGPIHAECRVNNRGVYVLEVAARPIGGLCAGALRFQKNGEGPLATLEEVLLRHALGESPDDWRREAAASGVMMIPIPQRGIYRAVAGVEEAKAVPGVDDVQITREARSGAGAAAGRRELSRVHLRARAPRRTRSSRRCARPTRGCASRSIPSCRCYNPEMADACDPVPSKPVGNTSGRKVMCKKLQKELPGLDAPPWPGELGQRIYENISAQAWKLWEDRMKMILNEYRLMPWQKEAQDLVAKHMEDFFFGEGSALPPEYVPAAETQVTDEGRVRTVNRTSTRSRAATRPARARR